MPNRLIVFHKKAEYTKRNLCLEETTILLATPQCLSIVTKELIIPPDYIDLMANNEQL
jgi:hypothetical protein